MEIPKRIRGRPIGTGIDDSVSLDAVADELTAHPTMAPMTAMGVIVDERHLGPCRDSAVRRLKRKWDKEGGAHLVAARQRSDEQQLRRAAEVTADFFERFDRAMRSPEMIAFAQKIDAYGKAAKQFLLSPEVATFVKKMDEYGRKAQEVAQILDRSPAWSRLGVIGQDAGIKPKKS